MSEGTSGKAACQTCRARHYECDKAEPTCRRCSESGRTCVPSFNIRFRRRRNSVAADAGLHIKGRLAFDKKQEWVKTPKTLSFVDETQSLGHKTSGSDQSGVVFSPSDTVSPLATTSSTFGRSTYSTLPSTIDDLQPRETSTTVGIADLLCSTTDLSASPESLQSNLLVQARRPSSLYVDPSEGNLINRRSAELLHYFKAAIGGPWFDVTDPEFTAEALRLAPTCPLLLYSMLAIASIHKSRFAVDAATAHELATEAEDFHEQCVSLLLPMLNFPDPITDAAFLGCSTILRFYEEISAPVHGRDDARHLLGGYASVSARQASDTSAWTGLSKAAFWVHQRQDAYNALINQRPPKTDLERCGLDRSMAPADGCTWAKRATCLNAEVVDFCFGADAGSTSSYHAVMARLGDWDRCKPDVFTPVFYQERDPSQDRAFPDLCLLLDYCAFGLSYHYFSMLLMTIFDPTVPRIGPMFLEGQKTIKENVLHYLRLLCGLAISNPVPPARVVTCLALSQCGIWVTELPEQKAMLEVLRLVEREDAWPTYNHQETLKTQWGHIS